MNRNDLSKPQQTLLDGLAQGWLLTGSYRKPILTREGKVQRVRRQTIEALERKLLIERESGHYMLTGRGERLALGPVVTAAHTRISAVWVCRYVDHGDGTCTVVQITREDSVGRELAQEHCWDAVEDPDRNVLAIDVGPSTGPGLGGLGPDEATAKTLAVRNRANIFSYNCGD